MRKDHEELQKMLDVAPIYGTDDINFNDIKKCQMLVVNEEFEDGNRNRMFSEKRIHRTENSNTCEWWCWMKLMVIE